MNASNSPYSRKILPILLKKSVKLEKLLLETKNCALMDSGCTATVCGKEWLKNYIASLTEYQCSKIVEVESSTNFIFGDGKSIKSSKLVTLPCFIGGMQASITTDVVESQIPLLMSVKSMKKSNMIWNFENDSVLILGIEMSFIWSLYPAFVFLTRLKRSQWLCPNVGKRRRSKKNGK